MRRGRDGGVREGSFIFLFFVFTIHLLGYLALAVHIGQFFFLALLFS